MTTYNHDPEVAGKITFKTKFKITVKKNLKA